MINLLVRHTGCNARKADQPPSARDMMWLAFVQERLVEAPATWIDCQEIVLAEMARWKLLQPFV